jgi:hypothetical protein
MEVKSQHILNILGELGLAAGKTHSSSLEYDEARRVRDYIEKNSGADGPVGPAAHRVRQGSAPKIDLSKVSKPGDVLKAILAKKEREEREKRSTTAKQTVKSIAPFVAGTPGYTSEFCGVGGVGPVQDYLNVGSLANRLADLMVLRETKLPLAIGLFGNWGSGKSHFMNLMDRRMKAPLAPQLDPTEPGSQSAKEEKWCRQIVPIYFNAWHYSDSNLWASLVTQVFEALFTHLRPKTNELMLLQSRLQQAGGVTALAEEEFQDAKDDVRKASERLADAHKQNDSAKQVLRGFFNGLRALIPDLYIQNREQILGLLGTAAEDATLAKLIQRRKEISSLPGRMRALWKQATAREGRTTRSGWLLTAICIALCARFVAMSLPQTDRLLEWMTPKVQAVLLALSAVIGWMLPAYGQFRAGLRQLEMWQSQAEAAQRTMSQNPQVAETESEVLRTEARVRAAERALAEAHAREVELTRALDDLRPERRLTRFIESRARSADYREQLGLVSLARRDFEELSRIFADTTTLKEGVEDTAEQARGLGELSASIDRVVLFIDDLDRCDPEKVVDVLQAVHLLLAYPLFGVVVGVDQRCLKQSLRIKFKGLLTPDHQNETGEDGLNTNGDEIPATPLDYLEKIFHIPFHLPPMGDQDFANLVEKLTEPIGPSPVATLSLGEPIAPVVAATTPSPEKKENGKSLTTTTQAIGSVPLYRWERDALKNYYSLISTPRGATRLLNTYRLVRAGVLATEWDDFRADEGGMGESRLAMLLLAVAAGQPAIARKWFKILRQREVNDLPTTDEIAKANQAAWANFRRLFKEFETQTKGPITKALVTKWIDRVELFTF